MTATLTTLSRPNFDVLSTLGAITEDFWGHWVENIAHAHIFAPEFSAWIADQALAYVRLRALHEPMTYPLSSLARKGHDALLTYTEEYERLCKVLVGRMIHYRPQNRAVDPAGLPTVLDTLTAFQRASIPVMTELWVLDK